MTYCFDLDGTLCTGDQYSEAQPIKSRIDRVNALYDEGHSIIIDTARGYVFKERREQIRALTIRQLRDWGVKYSELRVGLKVAADVYIDDKGLSDSTFFGDCC